MGVGALSSACHTHIKILPLLIVSILPYNFDLAKPFQLSQISHLVHMVDIKGRPKSWRKTVVIGAGPVGSLAALYAANRGDEVEVYELRSGKPLIYTYGRERLKLVLQ